MEHMVGYFGAPATNTISDNHKHIFCNPLLFGACLKLPVAFEMTGFLWIKPVMTSKPDTLSCSRYTTSLTLSTYISPESMSPKAEHIKNIYIFRYQF